MATPRTPLERQNASGNTRFVVPTVVITEKYAISGGLIEGWRPAFISGCRVAIDTTPSELWGGTAAQPFRSDTPGSITVVSGDPADGPAGVGAHLVLVEFIDDDGRLRFGVGALNGTTPGNVIQWTQDGAGAIGPLPGNPVASGIRVIRLTVIAMGSGSTNEFVDTNVGVLSGVISGTERAAVAIGSNTSECSCFYFPRGFFVHLESLALAAATVDKVKFRIHLKPFGAPLVRTSTLQASTTPLPVEITLAPIAPARTDFFITTERTSGGTTEASSAVGFVMVPDPDNEDPNPLLLPPIGGVS